jgi:FkbH-like protein
MKRKDAVKVALTGDVALELIAPYFKKAGFEVYVPAGFGAWRQELLDRDSGLNLFAPDFVYDVTSAEKTLSCETEGFYDERMRVLASMPYSLEGISAIVDEFKFRSLAAPKKILAVDADETLWKGVLSEDGEENLVPMKVFQEGLLKLRDDGVLLVLLSKNDPFVFRSDMPVSLSDFAAVRVGWSPKPESLAEICRELSLAADSVVFVDDNPRERAEMAARLDGVAVAPWNGWRTGDESEQRQLLRRIREYFFADSGATGEDRLRAAEYSRRSMLRDLQEKFGDVGGYLKDLRLTVRPSCAVEGDIERLFQMAMRTNQFNATTRRRTRDEFARLIADAGKRVYVFRAADRFGDQGLVCYVVVDVAAGKITDFVMSCRAMGRTLEYFVYRYVSRELGFEPEVEFVSTAKNRPFAEFLAVLGEGRKTWYETDMVQ